MKYFITGGAGFIGSHLVDRLIGEGHEVTGFDNLSVGKKDFIRHHFSNHRFHFIEGDILDLGLLKKSMEESDVVVHLASISDIRRGIKETKLDLEQGTLGTYNVLEAMRQNGIKKILFSSSNVVYGEATLLPTPENYGPLIPISLYAAAKLAAEALITAFCHNFNFQSWIYRFGNIVGGRATHGILYDFLHKLRKNPKELEVLGDGQQSKPYLEISDCVKALLFGLEKGRGSVNIFNLGTEGATSVKTIVKIILEEMGLKDVQIKYSGGKRGWPGDIPTVRLDSSKLQQLGWRPKYSSEEALRTAFQTILNE